jgi:hypothetical protein
MKQLEVPLLSHLNKSSSMKHVSEALNHLDKHAIDIAPWPAFDYVPKVAFTVAHNNDCIFLKYYVEEEVLKAAYYQPDDPVYKDSCVEFFIAFNKEEYYNLEFNAIGTCKLNFGKDRNDRAIIAAELIKKIRYLSVIQNADKVICWNLSLLIPMEVFSRHELTSLSGQKCRANFYKCGDDLPIPHFLCWNNIETTKPDFHVPRCFGKVQFL